MSELDDLTSATSLSSAALIESEKSVEQKEQEAKDAAEEFAVAALSKHPGWKNIKEMMEKDIDNFKSLRYLNFAKYSNEELGEAVRIEHLVAQKLQAYLDKVDEAVKAVSNGRPNKRT